MGKSKKGKKSRRSEEEDPETFHVEVITEARVVGTEDSDDGMESSKDQKKKKKKASAEWEYLVKWAGYESDANSWEPEENLSGCRRLLESFWKHVGTDDDDYGIGYIAKAKKEWIQSEKDFFAKEFKNIQAELKRQEKQEKEEKRKLKKAKKAKRISSNGAPEPTPVAEEVKHVQERQKSLPESTRELDVGVSSDDDQPLLHSMKVTIPKRKRRISSSSEEEPLQASQGRPPKMRKTSQEPIAASSPPQGSPTSLFSEPSSPEIALVKKMPQKAPVNKETSIVSPSIPPIKMTSRSVNPQAMIAHMLPSIVPPGGISTKMRLAQGALDPTLPKAVGAAKPSPKPLPPIRTTSGSYPNSGLKNMKMNKFPLPTSVPSGSASSPTTNEPTTEPLNSPSIQSPLLISGAFGSTDKMGPTSSIPSMEQNTIRYRPYVQEDTVSPAMIFQPVSMEETNAFLQGFMPPGLSAPLDTTHDVPMEVVPPKPIHPKLPLPGKIPKIWKWSGPLHISSHKNPICNVKIHHLTKDQALRFSIVFQRINKIEAGCFYDNGDLLTNLWVFRAPPQMALLGPEEDKDRVSFVVLSRYMEKNQKVFIMPITIDDNVVGQILFFPYIFRFQVIGSSGKDVPSEFNQPGTLVAALLPYTLSQEQLQRNLPFPRTEPAPLEPTLETGRWAQSLRRKPKYQHGLRVLGFSHKLHKYLAERQQSTVYVWYEKDPKRDGTRVPMETSLLFSILEQSRARFVAPNAEARFIFVHVGSLGTLYKLPSFVERRSSPFVQFYTYGSHQDVSSSLWGVREIYPWGGIVTFTPFAMHSDPLGVINLIRNINAHPRWTCYILPSALGMLAKLECRNEDPFKVFESRKLMMDVILEAIAKGDVALLHAPPEKAVPTSIKDARAEWLSKYLAFIPPNKHAALKEGITAFLSNHRLSKSDNIQRTNAMEEEILNDMALMQRQPVFVKEYRRYVVIDSEASIAKRSPYTQGLEWTSVAKFDFKDEFYPKQTVGSK